MAMNGVERGLALGKEEHGLNGGINVERRLSVSKKLYIPDFKGASSCRLTCSQLKI
jgi:hypothetical protein